MADFTANPTTLGQSNNIVLRALRSVWAGMIYLSEANSTAKALSAVAELSDEQLAKRGLTREDAVRRVLVERGYF